MPAPEVLPRRQSAPDTDRRTPADLWAFARAWGLLLAADLGLRAFSLPRMERWLSPGIAAGPPSGEATVGRLVWATAAAARHHLYPMRCLPRALCLRWLLSRQGIATELKIGVAREGEGLAAHAWVEREGRPVGEAVGVGDQFLPLGPA